MAGIFISCFPIFPPNMSGISDFDNMCFIYRWPLVQDSVACSKSKVALGIVRHVSSKTGLAPLSV